jgi:hypothetical protein
MCGKPYNLPEPEWPGHWLIEGENSVVRFGVPTEGVGLGTGEPL